MMKTYPCGCYGSAFQFCPLHAAAPDLLSALRGLVESFDYFFVQDAEGNRKPIDNALLRAARAALRAATGEDR